MSNIEMIQKLLKEKADLQAQINISAFDGSIEIKTVNKAASKNRKAVG